MVPSGLNEIKVPALGESIREATVARWLKSVGDVVKMDEVLVELETDKVTVEVNSPVSGTLTEVRVGNNGVVSVGDFLGIVTQGDASPVAPKAAPAKTAMAENLSPAVRKLTEELSINPKDVSGTGKANRLTKGDIINFSEGKTVVVHEPTPALVEKVVQISNRREERVKMTRLRQRIAQRLKEAQNTAAILTTFNEVDMTAVIALRKKYKETFEKKHEVRLGVMSFFVKACIQALKEIPAVNAEIDKDEIIYKNYYDIGVAVSTPQGLVVPIVRNADTLSFAELEKEISYLAHKARDGKLSIEEMTGGTFTISNGGVFGSLLATPILNPPQTGILGMHKVEDRPVVIDGKIEIRSMMYLALSYDHRVIDGRESVTFLVRVKENLENPERLLLDV